MTPDEARRHRTHLCDVYETTGEHIGVIDRFRNCGTQARVSGHPEHPARWLNVSDLSTTCTIPD